ncbi:hypothetical protein BJ322DRAFT_519849 [Thelephora terrestris]|uniref:Uncharacterized protein n=1 Tax=Thelephora terrestris TaxID=56493 RepID=A0A9P6H213_9AGAM|nr:hypothetical protein BJ322DRAFT_519849 [Thelephora terrestris]
MHGILLDCGIRRTRWVSFHHSSQWLLAELFMHVDILTEENLQTVGLGNVRDICLRNASEQAILTIIDFTFRVLSMIAQIRKGLWVRNGFAGNSFHTGTPCFANYATTKPCSSSK